jgi:hypothetical protein
LGRWVFDLLPELAVASKVVGASTEAVGEVAATRVVEVAVKEEADLHGVGEDVCHAHRKKDARSGRHATQ